MKKYSLCFALVYCVVVSMFVASANAQLSSTLADQATIANIAATDDNMSNTRSLAEQIVGLRLFLAAAVTEKRLGATKLSMSRTPTSRNYIGGDKTGETITISVSGGKLNGEQIETWETYFPYETSSLGYEPADIDISHLVAKLLVGFPRAELASFATDNSYSVIRKAAAEKLKDQVVLVKVALEDRDWQVRQAAVENLTDQLVLAKAAQDEDAYVRIAAVKKLVDQAVLAKVAVGDTEWPIREVAVGKLTDQTLLAKIAFQNEALGVRLAAIGNLADQAVLAKVAIEGNDWETRKAAVRKLTDQTVLAKVAAQDTDGRVREVAVGKLTNQNLLAKFAVADQDSSVREAAVESLTDQAALSKIADGKDSVSDVSAKAYARLNVLRGDWAHVDVFYVKDQALLAKVAMEATERSTREAAIEELTDQTVLAIIAEHDKDIRWEAQDRLKHQIDQDALAKAALEELDSSARIAAVEMLTDQVILAKVAVNDEDWEVRVAALKKLTDQELLKKLAVEDNSPTVERIAAIRLYELGVRNVDGIFFPS